MFSLYPSLPQPELPPTVSVALIGLAERRLILTRDAARKDAFVGLRIRYFDAPHYGKMKILVL
jgi:hypothetical protein